jgi:hypothetical protein
MRLSDWYQPLKQAINGNRLADSGQGIEKERSRRVAVEGGMSGGSICCEQGMKE